MDAAAAQSKVMFSVVVPLYNEEESLDELHRRLTLALRPLSDKFEIIFVDDGSTDNSFAVLKTLHEKDDRVKVIRFRKNFGKAPALSAGFKEAQGEIIITLDADLQDLPEEIPALIQKIEAGYDLVSGWKFKRKDPIIRKPLLSTTSSCRKRTSVVPIISSTTFNPI